MITPGHAESLAAAVSNATTDTLSKLQLLLEGNISINWRTFSFDDTAALWRSVVWQTLEEERDTLVPQLKAYQRLLRILPVGEERRALPLLKDGLHSAVQIASLPCDEFARRWDALFPGEDALGRAVHGAALARRGELLLHHVHNVQRNEPHYRAARFK